MKDIMDRYGVTSRDSAQIGLRDYEVKNCDSLSKLYYVGLTFPLRQPQAEGLENLVIAVQMETDSKREALRQWLEHNYKERGLPECLKEDRFLFLHKGETGTSATYQPIMKETNYRCGEFRIWLPLSNCASALP